MNVRMTSSVIDTDSEDDVLDIEDLILDVEDVVLEV